MKLNSKLMIILLVTITTIFASEGDRCTGRNGICVNTNTCSNYGGQIYSGKCPNDPNDIRFCDNILCTTNDGRKGNCVFTNQWNGEIFDGKCPGGSDFKCCVGTITEPDTTYNGPCNGGGGACINIDKVSCGTQTVSGRCPGESNVRCCLAGDRPSWYVDQTQHTDTMIKMPGSDPVNKSVASDGCGISSLSMAINVLLNTYVSPETLFAEAIKNNIYYGEGFGHDELIFLGRRHVVTVSWTDDISSVYNALESGKPVIFHVRYEGKYIFTHGGHYIFLYKVKKQNGVQKVYVFDPNGSNNYVNVLFPLRSSDGGIEVAKKRSGSDFGIVKIY